MLGLGQQLAIMITWIYEEAKATSVWFSLFDFADPKLVTRIWIVKTLAGDTILGLVKWWGAWRCYCFFPAAETLYEKVCLREIADFCEQATVRHREQRKTKS